MYHSLLGLALVLFVVFSIAEKESLRAHEPKKYRWSQRMLVVVAGLVAVATFMAVTSHDSHVLSRLTYWLLAFVVVAFSLFCISGTGESIDADHYFQVGCPADYHRFTACEIVGGMVLVAWPALIAWLWIWTFLKWLLR